MSAHSKKRILLTGATGLIGKYALAPLARAGYEVHAVSRSGNGIGAMPGVTWHGADLLEQADRRGLFADVRPECLLHFAWDMRPGINIESDENFSWLAASLEMLCSFKQYGGGRAVFAGTCFEYGASEHSIPETAPLAPGTVYAQCKTHLDSLAKLFCRNNGVSFGWGRIFYVYGAGEDQRRLTASLVEALRNGQEFVVKSGPLRRDYMYAGDVAEAFVAFLESGVEGDVNIATGEAIAIAEYCRLLGEKLGRGELIRFEERPSDQPPLIVADTTRLRREVGYLPRHNLSEGFDAMLAPDGSISM